MDKLKQLFKQLLAEKKRAQETYLKSILSKQGKCWSDFYKYVKRRKGNRENIPAIKDGSGRIITDPTEKANSLNFYLLHNIQLRRQYSANRRDTLSTLSQLILKQLGERSERSEKTNQ